LADEAKPRFFASEHLTPGDVRSTGTFRGRCGMELDRCLKPDDLVELEVPEPDTLTDRTR